MDEHCRKDSNISNMNVRMGLKNRVGGGSWQNNNCPFPLPIHIEGMTGSGYVTQAKTLPPLKSNY